MFVPYTVDVPMSRWPIANWVLIASTVAVSIGAWGYQHHHIYTMMAHPEAVTPEMQPHSRQEAEDLFIPPLALWREKVTLVNLLSYTLVHANLLHLAGNMIFLFCFGNAINAKLGHWQFLASYFLCGMVAGGAWLLFDNGRVLEGASGAIMGIVGLFLIFYPYNDVRVLVGFQWRAGTLEISSFWVITMYMVLDLVGCFIKGGGGGVAYSCHLAGSALGIFIGLDLLMLGFYPPTDCERNLLQLVGLRERTDDSENRPRRRELPDLPVAGSKPRRRK